MVGLTKPAGQNFPAQVEFMSCRQAEQRNSLNLEELNSLRSTPSQAEKTRSHYVTLAFVSPALKACATMPGRNMVKNTKINNHSNCDILAPNGQDPNNTFKKHFERKQGPITH